MPSLIAIVRKMAIEMYRIVLRIAALNSGSFICSIQLTNGTNSNIRRIVILLAQFSLITPFLP
jgi:hypothetical protein